MKRLTTTATIAALAGLGWVGDTFAQCAMCGSSFAENDPATQAFNTSVLFMMLAPYAIFFLAAGCVVVLYRRAATGHRGRVVPFGRHPAKDQPQEDMP